MVPLGLARSRREGATIAPDAVRSPAVAELLRLVGDGDPIAAADVLLALADGQLGLTEAEAVLVLNACARSGLVELLRGRGQMTEPFLAVTATDQLVAGELVETAVRVDGEHATPRLAVRAGLDRGPPRGSGPGSSRPERRGGYPGAGAGRGQRAADRRRTGGQGGGGDGRGGESDGGSAGTGGGRVRARGGAGRCWPACWCGALLPRRPPPSGGGSHLPDPPGPAAARLRRAASGLAAPDPGPVRRRPAPGGRGPHPRPVRRSRGAARRLPGCLPAGTRPALRGRWAGQCGDGPSFPRLPCAVVPVGHRGGGCP